MRIISVRLKNVKSHRATELTFSPGINVLSGPNGAGKSTVFEAIGYALFGVNAQDFVSRAERFLSIGEKKGEIAVVFEPADGEIYRATRSVGPAAKWLLAKKTGEEFEVEDHANLQETETRIASLLGLSSTRPLADQFKLVIGPFQNDFLGPFVIKQPTRRQDAFDEILGIDAWRKTFEGTKSLSGAIQNNKDRLKAEVAGREEQVESLPQRAAELESVRQSEKGNRVEAAGLNAALQAVGTVLAALDAEKSRLESLRGELQAIGERIAAGRDHVTNQQQLVEQSRAAADLVEASRKGKGRFDAAEERLKGLRAEEQTKLQLERKVAELDRELSALAAAEEIEERELKDLQEAIRQDEVRLSAAALSQTQALAELQSEEQKALKATALAEEALASFRALPLHRAAESLPFLFAALERLAALDDESQSGATLVARQAAVRAKAEEVTPLRLRLEKVQGERARLEGRRLSLAEGRAQLHAGECPYFGEPCRNLATGGAANPLETRMERLDREIADLESIGAEVAALLAAAQAAELELVGIERAGADLKRIEADRSKIERDFAARWKEISPELLAQSLAAFKAAIAFSVPSPPEGALECPWEDRPRERARRLEEWGERVRQTALALEAALGAGLKEAQEQVQAAERKKAELAARQGELSRLREDLETRKQKVLAREKAIAGGKRRLVSLREERGLKQEEVSRHEGLAERIAEMQGELERYRGDRDSFIANEKSALELEKRIEVLGRYQGRLGELEIERGKKQRELDEGSQKYSAERHEGARREREAILSQIATLDAELAALAENAQRLEGEVAALTMLAEEVKRKQAQIAKLARQEGVVKFLRNQVFKNVSSRLSERFREEISFRADRIYRSIADSDEELIWGENYQIVLKDLVAGAVRERTDDQLSGGQMMSAVVALRLALLQTIGARIAFFDEPTSNLDADRRENLARAFRAIDVGQEEVTEHWYDQLFLVSHDVSFTEITDQMIHLGEE